MVDILGVGVIVKGESGIGKSECVLALVERGYSLVADDITKLKLIDGRVVSAPAPGLPATTWRCAALVSLMWGLCLV